MMKVLTHIPHMLETKIARLFCPQTRFARQNAAIFPVLAFPTLALPAVIAMTVFGLVPLHAQQLQPQEPAATQAPAPQAPASQTPSTALPISAPAKEAPIPGEITEDYVKQMLVGKQLFLRGGYLGDSLSFDEFGEPVGTPAVGSFTLSAVQIDQVHLSKSRLELEGSRYAIHYLGAMPYEDDAKAVDRVKITPKKKTLHISIAREDLEKKTSRDSGALKAAIAKQAAQNAATAAATAAETPQPAPPAVQQPASKPDKKHSKEKEKAEDTKSATEAHEAKQLHDAIENVFAQGIDEKFRAKLPEFWQLYFYAEAAGNSGYRSKDAAVFRSSAVDTQARVLSSIAPQSNEFAQANGVAGQAIYRVVIGSDGLPGQIAVVRPIGFGLDENAVAAIRKATFAPAVKAGKPVSESLDLAVLFRIYSKQTATSGSDNSASKSPVKPGPYTAAQPAQQPAAQAPNQF